MTGILIKKGKFGLTGMHTGKISHAEEGRGQGDASARQGRSYCHKSTKNWERGPQKEPRSLETFSLQNVTE
jgi:hypothetical protein